jgi:hypothetical protein
VVTVAAAFAHQAAVIVRGFGFFRGPKVGEFHEENQNKENAEDRLTEAGDHGIGVKGRRHHRAKDRNCAENLCHIKFEPLFFLKKRPARNGKISATRRIRCRRAFGKTLAFGMRSKFFFLCVTLIALVGCATSSKKAANSAEVFSSPKLEVLNQQIQRNPEDAQAYSNRGYTLALLSRRMEARADLQKAVALKDNGPMHNRVGWAYFNMHDYREAVREFETAAKMSDHRAHYDYYSLVLGYWGTGQTKEALENYQLAVERDPRFGEYKTLNERTAEWTALERRAIHETYVLWSKTWKP